MAETSDATITVSRTSQGADEWPATSQPPSGAAQTEGCWFLGLPSARFTLDRPVVPGGQVALSDAAQAADHPLLRKLLEIEQVHSVLAREQSILVTGKSPNGDWAQVVKQVEETIRKHLESNEEEVREKIQQVLDREINPGVAMHGGHIDLLDVRGSTVYIKMGGGCQGCGMASVTLKQGVERAIKTAVPTVTEILDVTDHASGNNPFYAPQQK